MKLPPPDGTLQPRLAATILAAGAGSRLGYIPKAAIHIDGRPILHWQLAALQEAGIHEIAVVVGAYRAQMQALIAQAPCAVQAVSHDQPDEPDEPDPADLVASQLAALRSHARDRPGQDLLLMLGDLPFIRSAHLHPLQRAWTARALGIHALVPVVAGVRGHPVLLSWEAAQFMANEGRGNGGVRGWMQRNQPSVQFLELNDPAYTLDLDTPQDLQRFGGSILPHAPLHR
ncbi:MAG: hypothetical protein EOO31_02795 [Comamonadaceae bacterium]|nr:MAG: hypothetical protein EOO31_02795 [Comamonadaceae bacterium]